jgi:hemolysin III
MKMLSLDFKNEEVWNTLTHGIGALLSVAALFVLLSVASKYGSSIEIISAGVFGTTLLLQYLASTFYHAQYNPRLKYHWRKIDHLSIYLLIAGTYTPVVLSGLGGAWGWTIFGIIWGLAVLGFIYKLSPLRRYKKISLLLYLLMGWVIIIALKPMLETLTTEALLFLGIGGLLYTIGTYFYARPRIPYNHAIWHLFVLGGSALHFVGVVSYILPQASSAVN